MTTPQQQQQQPAADYVATRGDTVASPLELSTNTGAPSPPRPHNQSRRSLLFPPSQSSRRLWNQFAGDTLTSARMHTVGSTCTSDRDRNSERSLMYQSDETLASLEAQKTLAKTCADSPRVNATLQRIDSWYTVGSEYLQVPEGGTLGAAVFGLIKGTVGPAILYLPRGFTVSGYGVAIPSMLFATIMYVFNANRLLDCWRVEQRKDLIRFGEHTRNLLTYPELARRAFGPLSVMVDVAIAALQFGVCLTYLIFVPHNLHESTQALLGIDVDKAYFLLAMTIVEIPLGWIRDITKLTPTNVVATGLITYGLFFVLVMAFQKGLSMTGEGGTLVFYDNLENLPVITDSWFLFVGTSFFMMEGSITLLVPLQESLTSDIDRAAFPRTNKVVTTSIVIFYVLFSIICCGAFGEDIPTALTASLEGTMGITIQLAYSLAVILTFPLQAFPAMEVVKINLLGEHYPESEGVAPRVMSTLIICVLGMAAILAIDYLGNVVSILGSLFGVPLALVVPPLMHNTLVEDSSTASRFLNKCVVVIGFMAMATSSFATLVSWDKGAEADV